MKVREAIAIFENMREAMTPHLQGLREDGDPILALNSDPKFIKAPLPSSVA